MNKIKMKPILFSTPMVQAILAGHKTQTRRIAKPVIDNDSGYVYFMKERYCFDIHKWKEECTIACKYSKRDILWVRETWAFDPHENVTYVYKAQGELQAEKWKPSIFMPREAARIFLEVTNVRFERLHDISEEDAIAEGVITLCLPRIGIAGDKIWHEDDYPTDHYRRLWEKINGKGSWDLNPWVWVIEFKRLIQ